MYKQRRNLLALQKQAQRRAGTALALKNARTIAKYKTVARGAAQVTQEILSKQKSADKRLLRLHIAEQKKRLQDYAESVSRPRMKGAL